MRKNFNQQERELNKTKLNKYRALGKTDKKLLANPMFLIIYKKQM